MKSLVKTIFLLALFSIAMGFLESAVVVYLRKIYYPDGFRFPLMPIDPNIIGVELIRELATVIMLWSISYLTGKTSMHRFANFLFCFGIWDIFYYVFLKAILNWPESFLTPDILFLIPVPWVGPVLAPCLVSLSMITIALLVHSKNENFRLRSKEKLFIIAGFLVILFSFIIDYKKYIYLMDDSVSILNHRLHEYMPLAFNWWIFLSGEALLIVAFYFIKLSPFIQTINSDE